MFKQTIRSQIYFWLLLLFSSFSFSEWSLVNEESKLNFISIKASNIGEVHTFKTLSGSVTENGKALFKVSLGSVETLIPIRNERMENLLFETLIYPIAVFRLEVDLEKILSLQEGKSWVDKYRGKLEFKGKQFPLELNIITTRLNSQSFSVASFEPLLLNAHRLGLSEGIESLRAAVGLPSISKSVPVTFSLIFRK